MLKFKSLSLLFCLISTAASAAVVVDGVDNLWRHEQEQIFGILIQPKHDIENIAQIQAELNATLPGKPLNAHWVPDTLYQTIQSYFDVGGLNNNGEYFAKQADIDPKVWKAQKAAGQFRNPKYPTNLAEHKILSNVVVDHWARFNGVAFQQLKAANFQAPQGFQNALTHVFNTGPQHQRDNERRGFAFSDWPKHTSHLKKNEAFLRHALTAEEQAHQEGKLLFWRYSQPLPGNIPDLPFKIQGGNLVNTLNTPLEYFNMTVPRISYAARLLDGFYGDGRISEMPYHRVAASACTFSFLANDNALLQKGENIPLPMVYSLALTPQKVKELNDNLYLYHPREAVPQHIGIYGTNEGFHPGWLLDYQNKQGTVAWLDLMKSDALQVHLSQGVYHADPKNNVDAQNMRNIYGQFLNKARVENIAPPPADPIPVPPPAPVPAPVPAPAPLKKGKAPRVKTVKAPKVKKVKAPKVKKVKAPKVKKVRTPKVKKVKAPKVKKVKVTKVKKVKAPKVKKVKVTKVKKVKAPKVRVVRTKKGRR